MYCFSTSFCFLCLKHYPKTSLLDINKNQISNTKILDALQVCGIDFNYCDDHYQVYVCEKCVKKLEPFYEFKQQCAKNFTKLKGYVHQMKSNANIAFHADLKVILTDPKYGDNTNDTTLEYMDVSQFLEAQIQSDEMDIQQGTIIKDKPLEVRNNTMQLARNENNVTTVVVPNVIIPSVNIIPGVGGGNNIEQIYEMSQFIYDNHFMNIMPQTSNYENNDVIEIASSPESFNDIPQNSSGSFNDIEFSDLPKHGCSVCSKSFINTIQLSVHTFLHTLITYADNEATNSMKYYCTLCSVNVSGLAPIKKHLISHTHDKLYTCGACKQDFLSYYDLNKHAAENPSHKPYACKWCEATFFSERKLNSHTKKKHLINCMFCKSEFKTQKELKAHMKSRHNNRYCYICSMSFKSNDILKKHLFDNHFELQTIDTEGKPQYNCVKCSGVFFTKYSLNEHLGGCVAAAENQTSSS